MGLFFNINTDSRTILCSTAQYLRYVEGKRQGYWKAFPEFYWGLRPSINGLVTDGTTKLCCHGFVLALFQSTTAYKIDSEHTRDYTKLFPECKVEILPVTVNKVEVLLAF